MSSILIQDVSKTFETKDGSVQALNHVSLSIETGDIYGIIGMSGAGKSTLVRCMNFLERPTGGTVKIDGRDLAALSDKELRKIRQEVAMIFQHFNLLQQRNVRGNIAFSMEIAGMKKADIDARVDELLEIVDLKERALMYPAQLSGGQKQRVAIARALATNPKIILCDEATSALDPATTRSILALLKDINRKYGITIVIITHEMSVVESICSHVAIIDEGALVEAGTVEKVFTQPESETAKRIIFQKDGNQEPFGRRCIRIVFDGKSSYEPVVANLIMECKIPVNIMFADTKDIDGKAYGHMVLQLPEDRLQVEKAIYYLRSKNLVVEELENYV